MLLNGKVQKTGVVVVLLMSLLSALGGCATSPKINAVQMGDNQLTRDQLASEICKLDQSQQCIDKNKGVTGTNVAAALFWLPGLAYTYYDAGEATRLVNERRTHLTALYNQRVAAERGHKAPRRGA